MASGTAPAVDENTGRISGGGVAAHHDVGVAALLEVRIEDRFAGRGRPRLGTLENQFSTVLYKMMCCTKPLKSHTERVRRQCRVAGQALRPAQPPQNRTCGFLRIRLKHRPAHTRSTAGTARDGTSGGRERGSGLRWRGRDTPRRWCCRPARGPDRRPLCRPRTAGVPAPWRIRGFPQIHQMKCYSNSLKYHIESV